MGLCLIFLFSCSPIPSLRLLPSWLQLPAGEGFAFLAEGKMEPWALLWSDFILEKSTPPHLDFFLYFCGKIAILDYIYFRWDSIIIWYLYTVHSVHHYKSSYYPSSNSRLLSPILPSLTPLPFGNYPSILYICFIWFCFNSTYKWNHSVLIFLHLTYFT